ncbi:hypothetical protein MNB_SV-4-471 [hydrothermal vent metagenome]|uniref:Type II secretion system protein n=1 Tax=hydrothermal vent metagenome TaxID=652676 RepID=A0A1W1EAM5_9ZZZZ
MKNRSAFSLIELVFIIIITGIMAVVALPRFTGISDDARVSRLQAFTGTLNRSVGPMLWSNVQRREPGQNGSVGSSENFNKIVEDSEVDRIPEEFIDLGDPKTISLSPCLPSGTAVPDIGEDVGDLTDGKIAGTSTIGNTTYALGCIDSGLSSSPRFYLYDEGSGKIVY